MSFERFVHKYHCTNRAIVTINNKIVVFNSTCISKYSLDAYKYINLYYDRTTNKIGLEPTNGPDTNSYKLTRERSAVKVGIQAFTTYYDIPLPEESTRYEPELVDDMLVITLGEE